MREPSWCGRRVFQIVEQSVIGENLSGLSKRVDGRRNLSSITVNGVVKVSKQKEDGPMNEMYLSATIDLSARTIEGRKIFESFHIVAVPDGGLDTYIALRRRIKESIRSQLRRFGGTLKGSELFS